MEKCSLIRIFLGGHVGSHSQYEVFTLIYYRLGASSSDVDLIVVSDEIFIDTQYFSAFNSVASISLGQNSL
jgi:hypothetical protein